MAKNANNSTKFKDIISKSDLICSGPRAVYQLRPKKGNFKTQQKRMTVGEKNPKKKNKTILLVGETGAGKSTLINTLFNYSMGVKWEDQIWFQIVQEKKSQGESQTSDVIVYEIFDFEAKTLPYSLTIVDTPGYGDTRGFKYDDIIRERLMDLFRSDDGVHEVHVVGVVMKASDNRLSDRLMYSFDSVMSLFGNDVEKNIVALITHSNGLKMKYAINFLKAGKIKCAKNEKDSPVYFLFDNCQDAEQTEEEDEEEEEEDEEEVLEALQCADKISTQGMKKFTEFLGKTESQKLKITAQVLDERIRLTACIQNLQERINLTELKRSEIRQIKEALQEHEEEMKKNKEFIVEIDEVYKEKQNVKSGTRWLIFYEGAVTCSVCEENCHYPGCTKAWKPQHCEVMKGGQCTVCTKKCPASDHVKEKWIYVIKTRRVQKTIEDIKKKYGKYKPESKNKLSLLENLEKELNQLTTEKSQLLDESYQHIVRLEQLALKADTWSTIVHLDFLIEKLKEKGDTEKVQKLEVMRSRVDEGTRAALRYRQVQAPMSK